MATLIPMTRCTVCDGDGRVHWHNPTCSYCYGSGQVPQYQVDRDYAIEASCRARDQRVLDFRNAERQKDREQLDRDWPVVNYQREVYFTGVVE